GRTLDKDAEFTARMRVAQTALAVERYRLAHQGALPESLDDLTPACLPKLLTDLDGTPLHYQKRPAGFIVYSTGLDGVDDGGMEGDPKKPNSARDITFIIERRKPGTD
ncbi:MAG TPA: hypothetical protein VN673_09350, partial [Clostridia bacterium]|nr:hypothetical protein [Clostridia bacterium]